MSWKQVAVVMAAIAIGLTLPTGAAFAADAKLSVSGEVEYDDNIFRTDKDKEDDGIVRVTPRVEVFEDEGKFNWNLQYWMPYEQGLTHSDISDLNYFGRVLSEWQVTPTTKLTFNDRGWYTENSGRNQSFDELEGASVNSFREPVIRNRARLGIEHAFSPRLFGYAEFSHKLFHTDLPRRANNQTFELNTRGMYQVRPQHRAGAGIAASYQDFDESNNDVRPASQTLFVNMFGAWTWFIDEKTTFEIVGGPTFIDSSQDKSSSTFSDENLVNSFGKLDKALEKGIRVSVFDQDAVAPPGPDAAPLCEFDDKNSVNFVVLGGLCGANLFLDPNTDGAAIAAVIGEGTTDYSFNGPTLDVSPQDFSETSWTFFGQTSLTRRWTPHWTTSLSYTRRQTSASGVSGSAILDAFAIINQIRLAERWWLDVRGDFTLRQSTSETKQTLLIVEQGVMIPAGDIAGIGVDLWLANATGELYTRDVNEVLDTKRWGTTIRLRYRVNKNLWLSLRHVYNEQSSKADSVGNTSDFRNHLFTFGVQYDFDRIHLW